MIRRNTIQGTLVLEAVKKLACHPTADDIYMFINETHPNIGRGTVYRNLQRLCEMGSIRKVEIPSGADHFDHRCDNHYHIRCVNCNKVFDVDMEYIDGLEKNIKNINDFVILDCDIVFKGICKSCTDKVL